MHLFVSKTMKERERGEGERELAEKMNGDRHICIICLVILIQHYFVSNIVSVSHNSSSL